MRKFIASALLALSMLFSPESLAYKAKKTITLTSENTILLSGEMDWASTSVIMDQAQQMDAKLKSGEPIYLVLDTPGGSIQAGIEMITFLNGLNREVHTVSVFAASMGFQTVQGLGKRYITHFGTLMAHKAWGRFQGEFPGQIDSRYIYYLKKLDEIDLLTIKRSKIKSVKELQRLYENEYWVDGFDAVKQGLADEIVTVRCDHSLSGTFYQEFHRMGYTLRVKFSKCPMILGPLSVEAMIHTNRGNISLDSFLAQGGVFKQDVGGNDWIGSSLEATTLGLSINDINTAIEKAKKPKHRKVIKNPGIPFTK